MEGNDEKGFIFFSNRFSNAKTRNVEMIPDTMNEAKEERL